MEPILAWHGNPELKAEVHARMVAHRAQDDLVQGIYQAVNPQWASGYKGCLIGCTLPLQRVARHVIHVQTSGGSEPGYEVIWPKGGWHGRVEKLYGIPETVGHLLDRIFEELDPAAGQHARFAVESIEAIPVGADLSLIPWRLVMEALRGHAASYTLERERRAVLAVADLYHQYIAGKPPTGAAWEAARHNAPLVASDATHIWSKGQFINPTSFSVSLFTCSPSRHADVWWAANAERLLQLLRQAPVRTPVAS